MTCWYRIDFAAAGRWTDWGHWNLRGGNPVALAQLRHGCHRVPNSGMSLPEWLPKFRECRLSEVVTPDIHLGHYLHLHSVVRKTPTYEAVQADAFLSGAQGEAAVNFWRHAHHELAAVNAVGYGYREDFAGQFHVLETVAYKALDTG